MSFAGSVENGIRPSSAQTQVRVRALVTMKLKASTLRPGQRQVISGAVKHFHTGSVRLTIRRNGKPFLSKSVALKDSGYSFSLPMRGVGSYWVNVRFAGGDDDHLAGSAIRRFKVVR